MQDAGAHACMPLSPSVMMSLVMSPRSQIFTSYTWCTCTVPPGFASPLYKLRDVALREQRVIVQAELALQKKGEMAQLPAVWRAPASPRL